MASPLVARAAAAAPGARRAGAAPGPWGRGRSPPSASASARGASYLTASGGPITRDIEVKRSRFSATCCGGVESPEDAMRLVAEWSDPGASHNCFAFRIGQAVRFSDDGEPGGTAGRPILSAIEGEGLDRVVVLVRRWFGGTKLGTGGLVRAYGGAALEVLRACERAEVVGRSRRTIRFPPALTGRVYGAIQTTAGVSVSDEGGDGDDGRPPGGGDGGLSLALDIEDGVMDAFRRRLEDATNGAVSL